ncbi:PAS domain S-box protein [Chitinophagaceae bacterium MMS25-I14]
MQLRKIITTVTIAFTVFFLAYIYQAVSLYTRSMRSHALVEHTNYVLGSIEQLNNHIKDYESGLKSYLITGNESYQKKLDEKKVQVRSDITSLNNLISDNAEQQQRLVALGRIVDRRLLGNDRRAKDTGDASNGHIIKTSVELDAVNDEIETYAEEMMEAENQLLLKRTSEMVFYGRTRFIFSISGYLLMGVFLGIGIFLVDKTIRKRHFAEERARINEKKYRTLIDDSGMTSIVIGTDRVIHFVSKNVENLTGYTSSELKGKMLEDGLPRPYRNDIVDYINNIQKTENFNSTIELEVFTKSRTNKWINCRFSPIRKENDEIDELLIVIWDIDEEKKMRSELEVMEYEQKQQQQMLQELIDNVPNFIFVKDLEGHYLLANKRLKLLAGVERTEDINARLKTFINEQSSSDKYAESDRQVAENKAVVSFEEKMEKDGDTYYFQVVKFPLLDTEGNVKFICGVSSDITEHRESENKLREAQKAAEQARSAQETFLANMSHEIRTPMNGIIGMSNLLLSTGQDEEQKEYTETILESSRNLLSIINDLLDFSKIKSGKFLFENIPFKVRHVIRKAIYPLQFKAEEKQIGMELVIDDSVPDVLIGDPVRLQQILINLTGNAVKFTSEGKVGIKVMTDTGAHGDIQLGISVSDTGIGIAEDKLGYVFESFTQNNVNTSRKYGGTGLGLAIVKQLTEMQKGKVDVSSKIGEGSVFSVKIPYRIGKQVPVSENKPSILRGNGQNLLEGMHILVAEDNLINQKVVKNTLIKQGAIVDIVANGQLAIDHIEQQYYDVVLMDLQMPEVDGYKATRHIRQVLKIDVPIIAMTADALKGEAERCFDAGMTGFISKPFDPDDLYQQLLKISNEKKKTEMVELDPKTADQPLIDLSYLHELSGNDNGYMYEVLQIFLGTMPEGLEKLENLIRNTDDWESVYRQAHFLKSSVSIVKIRGMYDNLVRIESMAKNEPDKEAITVILDETLAIFKEAHPLLIAEKERNKSGDI